jgi:hypothetical protein
MPTATFYATNVTASASVFGGDVGVGATTWNGTEGNAAGPVDTSYATPAAPLTGTSWVINNLVFGTWINEADATSTISQTIPETATLTGLSVGIWAYTSVAGLLAYGRVNSARTNASAGTREGGFTLSTAPLALLSMNSSGNVIFGNRASTPIVVSDIRGADFKIVMGLLQNDNNGGAGRTPFVDAMYVTATWEADGFRSRAGRPIGIARSSR